MYCGNSRTIERSNWKWCRANCTTCVYGAKEFDGENCEYYRGVVCGHLPDDPLCNYAYLEDYGIDPEVEKTCWEPELWVQKFAVDAFELSQQEEAHRRFKETETFEVIVNQNK